VLDVALQTVRLFLHGLAATVWVGGQLSLAGLVPGLRRISPSAPRAMRRRFAQLAWPAYGVLIATGIWNILAVHAT
jgi:putative copper export protein